MMSTSEPVRQKRLGQQVKTNEAWPDRAAEVTIFQGSLYKKRGRGFWKFNASLLEDIEFVTKVEEILKEGKIEFNEVEDESLIWDTIKGKNKGILS